LADFFVSPMAIDWLLDCEGEPGNSDAAGLSRYRYGQGDPRAADECPFMLPGCAPTVQAIIALTALLSRLAPIVPGGSANDRTRSRLGCHRLLWSADGSVTWKSRRRSAGAGFDELHGCPGQRLLHGPGTDRTHK